jgi:hypothetical protein
MRLGGLSLIRFVRSVSIEAWMAAVVLVPTPLWFLFHAAADPGPAWRAEYFADATFGGASQVVAVRHMQEYWDTEHAGMPNGADPRSSSVRYETCIDVEAAIQVPILLVASGAARFSLGSELELSGESPERWVRSKELRLPPGSQRLTVELSARGWPSIGLLASFDGRAPVAVGSGELASGVRTRLPHGPSDSCAPPP